MGHEWAEPVVGIMACKKCGVYYTEVPGVRAPSGYATKKCGIPHTGPWRRSTYTDNVDWWRRNLEDSRDLPESEAGTRRATVVRPIEGTETILYGRRGSVNGGGRRRIVSERIKSRRHVGAKGKSERGDS